MPELRIRLTLRSLPSCDGTPPEARLRAALKALRRRWGWECVRVEEWREDEQQQGGKDDAGTDAV